jgi:hypothetical protein
MVNQYPEGIMRRFLNVDDLNAGTQAEFDFLMRRIRR